MKKVWPAVLVVFFLFFWGCGKEPDALHMGLNAVVLGVDLEEKTVTVTDPAGEGLFGDSCILTGGMEVMEVVYCDFEAQVLTVIDLQDLIPGDEITVNAYVSELKKADSGRVRVQQIQLMTQRIQ